MQDVVEYNPELFSRWLRMLLVAFYNTEETVVADLLCQRAQLMRDTTMSQVLGLPEAQIRKALSRRLVPDCLVERLAEGEGNAQQFFYRISAVSVAVSARRLQGLEDSLGIKTEHEFKCQKCSRVFDPLQAMASVGGAGGFVFKCDFCNVELVSVGATASERHDRQARFRDQCHDLLQLTRRLKDMPIPHFGHAPKAKNVARKRKQGPADDAPAAYRGAATADPIGAAARYLKAHETRHGSEAAEPKHAHVAKKLLPDRLPLDAQWLEEEVLGFRHLDGAAAPRKSDAEAFQEAEFQEVLCRAQQRLKADLEKRFRKRVSAAGAATVAAGVARGRGVGSGPSGSAEGDVADVVASQECQEEVMVSVSGKPYPLSRVCKDIELQDEMSDTEFQRFVDAQKARQGLVKGKLCGLRR